LNPFNSLCKIPTNLIGLQPAGFLPAFFVSTYFPVCGFQGNRTWNRLRPFQRPIDFLVAPMGKSSISQTIEELITPVLKSENLELVDVEYKKEGKTWFLRLFIDKEGGITVGDCQKVSRQLEDLIEVEDVVPNHYTLEVSSPGLDRPLKKESDFVRFVGRLVAVSTFSPVNDRKKFTGTIDKFENQVLFLDTEGQKVAILYQNIAKAKLEFEF